MLNQTRKWYVVGIWQKILRYYLGPLEGKKMINW